MAEPFPLAPSLWAATAPPAPSTPPLEGSVAADVVVIGAGYCGLSTALHLAERGIAASWCWKRMSRAGAARAAMAGR